MLSSKTVKNQLISHVARSYVDINILFKRCLCPCIWRINIVTMYERPIYFFLWRHGVAGIPRPATRFNFLGWGLKKNFANKIFGYLARCEGKFCTTTLKNKNFGSKWDENADTHSAKIWNFDFWKIWYRKNTKSGHQNQNFDF